MLDPYSAVVVAQMIAWGTTALFFGVAYPTSIMRSRRRWRRLAEALDLERWKLITSFRVAGGVVGERQGFGVRVLSGSDGALALGIPTEIDLAQEHRPSSAVRTLAEPPIASRAPAPGRRIAGRLVVVLKTADGRLASAAASALGQTGRPEAESSLLDALASGPPVVQGAAVEALAYVGTARSIQPLRALSERGERELRRAARQSVAQLQARLPGASPGQLSMADEQLGQVSLTDDDRGRISLGGEPDESA